MQSAGSACFAPSRKKSLPILQTLSHPSSPVSNAPIRETSATPTSSLHIKASLFSAFRSCSRRYQQSAPQALISSDSQTFKQADTETATCDTLGDNTRESHYRPFLGLSGLRRALYRNRTKEVTAPGEQTKGARIGKDEAKDLVAWKLATSVTQSREQTDNEPQAIATDIFTHGNEPYTALPADDEDRHWEFSFGGGAAARAAAAAQNGAPELARQIPPKDISRLRELRLTSDSESGIGIELREQPDDSVSVEDVIVRRDPAMTLPTELFTHILQYLDAYSIVQAELVSRLWHATASTCYIWRNIFVGDYGRAPYLRHESSSCRVGGLGFGLNRPKQEWKKMWIARKALQARWSHGRAAAAYLEGHQDTVYCVQFDEHKILTGSRDRTIRVWDATTFECLKILGVPKQSGSTQVMPPLPQRSHKGNQPFDVIHPRLSSQPLRYLTAEEMPIHHHGSILCLQFDDDLMVTGSSDTTLIMWDIKTGWTPSQRLRQHRAGVLDVCFNAKCMVSCSKDTTICVWDRSTGTLSSVLAGHRGPVNAVQLRGDLIVSASGDGVAKLWNVASGLCVKEFPSRDRGLACVEFSPDCRTIFAGGNDQMIYQFDASNGDLVRELRGHSHLVRSLHLDYLNGRVVSGSYDKSIKVYNVNSGEMLCDFGCWTTSWILSAKSDYRRIIATSQDRRVVVIDFGHDLSNVDLLRGSEPG